ncbi:VanZ family protein [Methylomonas montana]|uniref:VanZ family protein n=1 Tax=Methylomonas montana TaxID=3058963 RepID=UPI0026582116|nr:VanZ family protein [Methylomonas montana]WKJ89438.1 VanZ family protein [Methylomonas montana]
MKNRLLTVCIIYTAFVVYGSLVPWQFRSLPLNEAWSRFHNIQYLPYGVSTRSDWVANILLFIPLTFLWLTRIAGHWQFLGKIMATALILGVGFLLCSTIEFAQLFFPPRSPSLNDIVAESIGGVLGAAAWWFLGQRFANWLESWKIKKSDSIPYLQFYLVCMFFYNVMPLDLTLSPVEFYHKWHEGRVILLPFSGLKGDVARDIYDSLADIALWLPVPWLWLRFESLSKMQVLKKVFFAAVIIEFFQLFVYSRVTDVTDVLLAVLGGSIGVGLIGFNSKLFAQIDNKDNLNRYEKYCFLYALLLYFLWVFVIISVFWYPFGFEWDYVNFSNFSDRFFRIPFYAYYYGTEYRAITEVFHKILFFIPLGVIIGQGVRFIVNRYKSIMIALVLIACTSLVVELGQMFLPNKNADITDVVLEILGGYIGFVVSANLAQGSSIRQQVENGRKFDRTYMASNLNIGAPHMLRRDDASNINNLFDVQKMWLVFWAGTAIPIIGALMFISGFESVPYNVRELFSVDYPIISALGLTILIYWCFSYPLYSLMRVVKKNKLEVFFCVKVVMFHSLVAWLLVRAIIPIESIHDILGSPILSIPVELELVLRFVALFSVYSLMTLGATHAALLFVVSGREFERLFFLGAFWLLLLLPVDYWVVVIKAATDNLTELMVNDGHSFSVINLCIYFFLVGWLGASISTLTISHNIRRVAIVGFVFLVSFPLGYQLLSWGTEQFIFKYDTVFSALNFLLSADRNNFVSDNVLKLRFFIVHLGLVSMMVITQVPVRMIFKNI